MDRCALSELYPLKRVGDDEDGLPAIALREGGRTIRREDWEPGMSLTQRTAPRLCITHTMLPRTRSPLKRSRNPAERIRRMHEAAKAAAAIILISRKRCLTKAEKQRLAEFSEKTEDRLIEQELYSAGLSEDDLDEMAK